MHAQRMRNSTEIFHGDHTRCEKFFLHGLFEVANLLVKGSD